MPLLSEFQRKIVFQRLALVITLICLLNIPATLFYWYSTIWWFDILMHFLGGFFVALLSVWVFTRFIPLQFLPTTTFKWILLILLSAFIIGFAWEIYELAIDVLTGAQDFGYLDAFSDLWNDLSGACFALVFLPKK